MVRKLAMAVALALGSAATTSYGLGLGDIKIRSALNQNFDAEIELLSVAEGEMDGLRVQLAPADAFARAGIDRPYYLSQLRFTPQGATGGKSVIRVTTDFPVREPFLNFLVEVNWPNGRVLREYTALLDPPTTTARRAPQVSRATVAAAPAPAARVAPQRIEPAADEYRVQANDTLWGIARGLRPTGVTMSQMMMALLQANPQAFVDNNINRLKRGQILRVPGRDEILGLSRQEAQAMYRAQQDAWLAERAPVTPSEPADAATTAESAESAAADQLRIAAAKPEAEGEAAAMQPDAAGPATAEELNSELLLARENAETSRIEAEQLRQRVDDLRAQLDDMQRLLTLKDDQLAQLQDNVAAGETTVVAETEQPVEPSAELATAEEAVPAETVAAAPAEEVPDDVTPTALTPEGMAADATVAETAPEQTDSGEAAEVMAETVAPAAEITIETESPVAEVEAPVIETAEAVVAGAEPGAEEAVAPAAETVAEAPEVAPVPAEPPVAAEPAEQPPVAEQQPAAEPAWMNELPLVGGGIAAVVALGGLFGFMAARRRKQAGQPQELDFADLTGDATKAAAAAAGAGAVAAAADKSADLDDLPDDEAADVDPVSEADVYIAYGRYQQAEQLLRQAIDKDPERLALPHKLLEVYYATRKTDAFVALANEMVADGRDQADPEAWARAKEMGRELAPDAAVFAAVAGAAGVAGLAAAGGDSVGLEDLELSELASEIPADESTASSVAAEMPEAADLNAEVDLDSLTRELEAQAVDEDSLALDDLESFDLNLSKQTEEAAAVEDEEVAGMDELAAELDDGLGEDSVMKIDTELDPSELGAQFDELSEMTTLDAELAGFAHDTAASAEPSFDEAFGEVGDEYEPETLELDTEAPSQLLSEDDVDTKLDLARAYVEMGDAEGARSILDEVQEEGTEAQQSQAREILEALQA